MKIEVSVLLDGELEVHEVAGARRRSGATAPSARLGATIK